MNMREVLEAMRLNGLYDEAAAVGIVMQQRAELLEVLKEILCEYEAYNCYASEELIAQAHSAITKAEATE